MRVKNIIRIDDYKCESGSWFNYWKKINNSSVCYCSEKKCLEKSNLVGVHVQKADLEIKLFSFNLNRSTSFNLDTNWDIIPMCEAHSKSGEEVEVTDILKFVQLKEKEIMSLNLIYPLVKKEIQAKNKLTVCPE